MKERQKQIKNLIKKIAKERNLTEEQIADIENSMWDFVRYRINETNNETEEHSNIYLRFMGTIYVAPGRIKKIKENIKKNENT